MNAKPGLSLIEVMLAILIVGITVTSLLSLQGKLSRAVFTAHALIDRIPFIISYFVEADREKFYAQEKSHKKVIEHPQLTMAYSASRTTSRAFKNFQNIVIERIEAQWPTVFGTRTETFVRARFVPKAAQTKQVEQEKPIMI